MFERQAIARSGLKFPSRPRAALARGQSHDLCGLGGSMRRFVPDVLSFGWLNIAAPAFSPDACAGSTWPSPPTGMTNARPPRATAGDTSPTWWKVDTHEHSSINGDGRADLAVVSVKALAAGHNAVFLTDHDCAASFSIDLATVTTSVCLYTQRAVEREATRSSLAHSADSRVGRSSTNLSMNSRGSADEPQRAVTTESQ